MKENISNSVLDLRFWIVGFCIRTVVSDTFLNQCGVVVVLRRLQSR